MTVILNTKEITEVRRLEKCLASGLVPVMDVQNFLSGIRQKVENGQRMDAGPEKKRKVLDRKSKYSNL